MNEVAALIELLLAIGVGLVLLWFIWRMFLRRLWRVTRIRHFRERREIQDAAARNRDESP